MKLNYTRNGQNLVIKANAQAMKELAELKE